jgi:hypothetical protein
MKLSAETTKEIYNIQTYLVTAYNRFLHERLRSIQLANKFPAFYGTRKSITGFTSARPLSLF